MGTYSGYLARTVIFWWWIWDSNGETLAVSGGYTLFTALGMYGLTMSIAFILWFVMERPMRNLTKFMMDALVARLSGTPSKITDLEMVNHHQSHKEAPESVRSRTSIGNGTREPVSPYDDDMIYDTEPRNGQTWRE